MERSLKDQQFITFLQDELAISAADIAMALRHRQRDHDPLPMLLWQYGLVSLDQLSRIFDWRADQFQLNLPLG